MVIVIAAVGLLAMAAAIFAKVTRTQVRASAIAVEIGPGKGPGCGRNQPGSAEAA